MLKFEAYLRISGQKSRLYDLSLQSSVNFINDGEKDVYVARHRSLQGLAE